MSRKSRQRAKRKGERARAHNRKMVWIKDPNSSGYILVYEDERNRMHWNREILDISETMPTQKTHHDKYKYETGLIVVEGGNRSKPHHRNKVKWGGRGTATAEQITSIALEIFGTTMYWHHEHLNKDTEDEVSD